MSVTEDEVVRRRLLIEGDGTGTGDKTLMRLNRMFIEYCNDPNPDVDSSKYQDLMCILSQCEYNAQKTELVRLMNLKEQERYEKLDQSIGDKIEAAQFDIEDCKSELVEAKVVRKNKREYDAWAKKVMEHPDRETTTAELREVHNKIEDLNKQKTGLLEKLDLRKKQCAVLITAIHDMQQTLEEEKECEGMDMSATE